MKKKDRAQTLLKEEKSISNFEDIFQLWKDIPIVQNVSDQTLFKATNHPIQKAILKILREGIIDQIGKKRHFLTANELLEIVNVKLEGIEKSIKISMLYYHLDILSEAGFVEYVYYIEGRHKRKFFGRTAKFYLFSDSEAIKEKIENFFSPIEKLLTHYNPDIDINEYRNTVEQINIHEREYSAALVDWLRENHELLYDLDIDALELFTALSVFVTSQGLVKQLFEPLTKNMKFLEKAINL